MAISVNAVNLDGRTRSLGAAAPQQRWQQKKHARRHEEHSQAREVAASPILRLRASDGRRVKPTLRRKRIATMRSVNGWIRETDPTPNRRHISLDRRIAALRKNGNRQRKERRTLADYTGASKNLKHLGGDGSATFLTELETDGVAPTADIHTSHGNSVTSISTKIADHRRRGEYERGNQYQRSEGKASTSGMAQKEYRRRRSSTTKGGACSTVNDGRRSSGPGVADTRRGRSEVTRFSSGKPKSVGTVSRRNQQRRDERYRTPVTAGRGAVEHHRDGGVKRHPGPPAHTIVSVRFDVRVL